MTRSAARPAAGDYAEFYAGYVDLVPDGDVLELLTTQRDSTIALLAAVPPELEAHRYAPGKWSLVEVVRHLVDTEWIFTYRALRFARGDATALPGMDQDQFALGAQVARLELGSILDEYRHLRTASTLLFSTFDDEVLEHRGEASGFEFSVRALLYVIAGHELHHLDVLRERYLAPA